MLFYLQKMSNSFRIVLDVSGWRKSEKTATFEEEDTENGGKKNNFIKTCEKGFYVYYVAPFFFQLL